MMKNTSFIVPATAFELVAIEEIDEITLLRKIA